jgi:hypothetical protein
MSSNDRSWRDVHFGKKTLASRLGLIPAPVRETVSDEMAACRELDRREVERLERIDREHVEHVMRLKAEEAKRRRQRADVEAEAALKKLSPELRARARQRFGLPESED